MIIMIIRNLRFVKIINNKSTFSKNNIIQVQLIRINNQKTLKTIIKHRQKLNWQKKLLNYPIYNKIITKNISTNIIPTHFISMMTKMINQRKNNKKINKILKFKIT